MPQPQLKLQLELYISQKKKNEWRFYEFMSHVCEAVVVWLRATETIYNYDIEKPTC